METIGIDENGNILYRGADGETHVCGEVEEDFGLIDLTPSELLALTMVVA